ncbi:hypothetical protein TcWFU_009416 [Taenia crassiceps]|uniref:Uncharacterized protein n=1 Tax=Taenia crassiceps TaxID=6207 RepID=A0ABR4QK55_9CEST
MKLATLCLLESEAEDKEEDNFGCMDATLFICPTHQLWSDWSFKRLIRGLLIRGDVAFEPCLECQSAGYR